MILFVCTGNTCRSPMAELYFNYCRKLAGKSACAASCGIATANGLSISENAAKVMEQFGIDSSTFRSTRANRDLLDKAEAIFTMSSSHKRAIEAAYPEFSEKISTLLDRMDVDDPYGMDFNAYMETFNMMKDKIEFLAKKTSSYQEK